MTTGFDPYLDDPATLWLIHWKITNNYKSSNGHGIGHLIFSAENQFTPDIFKKTIVRMDTTAESIHATRL